MSEGTPGFRDEALQVLVDLMERNEAPWQKEWKAPISWPYNSVTGMRYRGGNAMWLAVKTRIKGWQDPRWMTYRQAQTSGWQVRRGEKGTTVEYWLRSDGQDRFRKREVDAQGRETEHFGAGYRETDDVSAQRSNRLSVRLRTVFNAEQVDGIPSLDAFKNEIPELERGESLIHALGVPIEFHGDRAYYAPVADAITLPPRSTFQDQYAFYAAALHEIGHATGHHTRCGRMRPDGSSDLSYPEEELVAELHAFFASMEAGLPFRPSNHAAYLENWRAKGGLTKHSVFTAAGRANRALEFVLNAERMRLTAAQAIDPMERVASGAGEPVLAHAMTAQRRTRPSLSL